MPRAGVLGCGHALPPHTRGNDDPLYAQLDRTPNDQGVVEADLFVGMGERRYLGAGELIEPLMVAACSRALAHAGIEPSQVERLYGYASVPTFVTPNSLFTVHRDLGLSERAMVIPVNSEFSNFAVSLAMAGEAVDAGRIKHALVVCGSNWTRHVDYTKGHAITASDAAAAAVVAGDARLALVDHQTRTYSDQFHSMRMYTRSLSTGCRSVVPVGADNLPVPTYEIDATEGVAVYQSIMKEGLPDLVNYVLACNGVTGRDVALITHQGSRTLIDHWADRIGPRQYLETFETFGNMTLATYPVNLSHFFTDITSPYVMIAAVGPGFHLTATLLRQR
ncbi:MULTISPECIES: 3-oxoacyl-[acyl-carrier-protein] synthase III C-terminal domain-containing protein [Nocardioides]|uniref:3-oxoacyl-[acyl-carrier-protein] synthase III C-terminal domain-containing protein n=1 Tax=Nocardioides vastitatis TaxID=2568655 RepID=A0ABW0ZKR9_9ACTN|nr:3-oxoacyl-[acyl-carrier-protein] synthase III C-terminal domain-containing protein [Nocardioides sp.]